MGLGFLALCKFYKKKYSNSFQSIVNISPPLLISFSLQVTSGFNIRNPGSCSLKLNKSMQITHGLRILFHHTMDKICIRGVEGEGGYSGNHPPPSWPGQVPLPPPIHRNKFKLWKTYEWALKLQKARCHAS